MKLDKLLKIIKKHHWWEESAPGVFQFIMYPLHGFIEQAQHFHPHSCLIGIFLCKDDFFYENTSEEEKYAAYQYIFKQSKRDRRYLSKKRRAGDKNKQFITVGRHFEQQRCQLSNRQFWASYKDFMMKY